MTSKLNMMHEVHGQLYTVYPNNLWHHFRKKICEVGIDLISKFIIEMPRNIIDSYDKGGLISESFLLWLKSLKEGCQITMYPLGG